MKIILILMCFLCLPTGGALAEETITVSGKPLSENNQAEEEFQEWAFFPVIASETETGLQLGGLAVKFLKPESQELRTSTIDFVAFGTANGQYYAGISPDLYLKKDAYRLNLTTSGRLWPANYYGIGNDTSEKDKETFESTGLDVNLAFERKFVNIFYAGIVYRFQNSWIEPESQGVLENGSIIGEEGGRRSGLGGAFSLDTRDNTNDARDGTYVATEAVYFRDRFGSDFDYSLYQFDIRQFITLAKVTSLGIRGYVKLLRGDIPFQDLSSPDGFRFLEV